MTFRVLVFLAKHIPGSLNVYSEISAKGVIEPSDELVLYCVNEICLASITADRQLSDYGFTNVSDLPVVWRNGKKWDSRWKVIK